MVNIAMDGGDWNMTVIVFHRFDIIIPIDELILFRGLKPPTSMDG